MDKSSKTSGGLWNCGRPITYSQETQELLKLMMQESHLANVQKRQIRECLKTGAPLHLACASKPSPPTAQSFPSRFTARCLPGKPQRRTAEMCKSGDSYSREKFRPGPTRDLEQEKRRLQRILEMGKDPPKVTICQGPQNTDDPQEKDRFDEILEEIEERRQFLKDMSSLGHGLNYVNIINTEISQRIRELDKLKSRSVPSEGAATQSKVDSAEEKLS